MDTIVALASARGRAGVAVVRVSGPEAWEVCRRIAGDVPPVRRASLRSLRDPDGGLIDQALVLVFEAEASFTGERVCEFQVHGGVAVVAALLRSCLAVPGVRGAEAGEYTRRAFFAGRLDLTQVEALADLIEAETEAQRLQALAVLEGSTAAFVKALREDLMQARAMLEAALDFADQELPEDMTQLVDAPLLRVEAALRAQIAGRRSAEAVRDGFEVAIIGRVNAGKSSLLNALAGREAALTSSVAGTTRDVIEVRMDIGGLPVTLIDTAGLRETQDEIESIGIARGRDRARAADLRVFLKDSPDDQPEGVQDGDIILQGKADIWGGVGVSAKTGDGIADLLRSVEERLRQGMRQSSVFSRERHFHQIQLALQHVGRARASLPTVAGWDLACEDVRSAQRCLDGIQGAVDVEDVLGRIFSSFCIGK